MDDEIVEDVVESLNITLERTPYLDIRITLHPVNGVVEITDDDGGCNNYMFIIEVTQCVKRS